MNPIRAADMVITDADLIRAAGLFDILSVESLGGYENPLYRSVEP